MPELVFFRRGDEVLRVSLDRPRTVLGRGEKSDVVLPDPEVSRQQAALSLRDGAYRLEDLSGHGTLVAGQRVNEVTLQDGVDIGLGQWRALFRAHVTEPGGGDDGVTRFEPKTTAAQPTAAPESARPARVRIRRGAQESLHRIPGGELKVGSSPDNDVVLEDPFVSGHHLRIVRRESGYQLLDRGSTNGTFLGPVRIFEIEAPLGTTVRVGQSQLTLEAATREDAAPAFEGMIGKDPSIAQLAELIQRVAPSNAPVSIFGESGTGKELVARALHVRGDRADKPFIPINCAAISKELIESELFGHEKGAFTGALGVRRGAFEEADGGTLFLDEIGELPHDLQAKLLRALESGEIKRVGASRPQTVDVRIVAATHRDLIAMSKEGTFREDLYYRLCVVPLHLPPLRARPGDVPLLAQHFVGAFAPRGQTLTLTPAAQERLKKHPWPGNVRELRNVIHRALLLRRGEDIDADDITFDQEVDAETGLAVPDFPAGMSLEAMLERVERQLVEKALARFGNNRERVARELQVARSTLFKKLKDWGMTRQEEPPAS